MVVSESDEGKVVDILRSVDINAIYERTVEESDPESAEKQARSLLREWLDAPNPPQAG